MHSKHGNKISLLTQVGTEGHVSSSGGYSATVGPSGGEWVATFSTSQMNQLRSISDKVETLSTAMFGTTLPLGKVHSPSPPLPLFSRKLLQQEGESV